MAKESLRNRKGQGGAAMLIMVAILTIGITSLVLAALKSSAPNEVTEVRNRNAAVLAQAKEALIGYIVKQAASYTETAPGELPCPESLSVAGTAAEGANAAFCTAVDANNKTIGRLPWVTLGVDKLVDATSEPLWYAVSQKWVPATAGNPPIINIGTANAAPAGNFTVDGVGSVVAVIIAPGRPLNTNPTAAQVAQGCAARNQARNDRSHVGGGGNPDYRDYLECENASAPIDVTFGSTIIDNASNPVINDQMVTITAGEILNAIQGPLSDRMQRTVAPLLSEYTALWPGGTFSPYATAFSAPESNEPAADHCGPSAAAQTREGLLPIAPSSGTCASDWTSFAVSGSGTGSCVTLVTTNVRCTFTYYTLNALGAFLFGSATHADVTIQATAPHASASFRGPLKNADIIVPDPSVAAQSTTLNPQTDGDARMTLVVRITGVDMCDNSLLGVVCSLLGGLLIGSSPTTHVDFPQLGSPMLQGTKLPADVVAASLAAPFNLLSPTTTSPGVTPAPGAALVKSDPHYWFMHNEWYRYTYYAVSGSASAAASGGNLTITGFPAANGNTNDKRFVLTLMGPAVAGQARAAGAPLANYVEGANAASGALPRVFAYEVYTNAGNDRVATCPFVLGATNLCN